MDVELCFCAARWHHHRIPKLTRSSAIAKRPRDVQHVAEMFVELLLKDLKRVCLAPFLRYYYFHSVCDCL